MCGLRNNSHSFIFLIAATVTLTLVAHPDNPDWTIIQDRVTNEASSLLSNFLPVLQKKSHQTVMQNIKKALEKAEESEKLKETKEEEVKPDETEKTAEEVVENKEEVVEKSEEVEKEKTGED